MDEPFDPSVPRIDASPMEALIVVKRVEMADGAQVFDAFVADWWPVEVSYDEARRLVSAVTWDDAQQVARPHVLHERLTRLEWGASHEAVQYLIDIARDTPKELIYTALGWSLSKLAPSWTREAKAEPMTLDVALDKGRQAVAVVYDVDASDLVHVGEEMDRSSNTATVQFRHSRGDMFHAEVGYVGNAKLVTRVARTNDHKVDPAHSGASSS